MFKLREFFDQFMLSCPHDLSPTSNLREVISKVPIRDLTYIQKVYQGPHNSRIARAGAHLVLVFCWKTGVLSLGDSALKFYRDYLSINADIIPQIDSQTCVSLRNYKHEVHGALLNELACSLALENDSFEIEITKYSENLIFMMIDCANKNVNSLLACTRAIMNQVKRLPYDSKYIKPIFGILGWPSYKAHIPESPQAIIEYPLWKLPLANQVGIFMMNPQRECLLSMLNLSYDRREIAREIGRR